MYLCILKKIYIMTENDVQVIRNVYLKLYKNTQMAFKRYLHDKVNWDARLIGIKGMRGVGKTTMLLQHIKETFAKPEEAFYVSLDHFWFQTNSLPNLADYLYTHGVRHLYLDEVHKYPNWSIIIKNLYDTYDDLTIVYTGSSMLEIDNSKADLSRRQTMYTLEGMSFREYLAFTRTLEVDAVPLEKLLTDHLPIAMNITEGRSILPIFEKYLRQGYYPFAKEAGRDYHIRLTEVANLVIESDMPAVEGVSYTTIQKTKQLLMVIAQNVPLVPNISQLCSQLGTTRDSCLKMLYSLDKAGLLSMLTKQPKDYKHLVSPEKIFLNNGNLMYAITSEVNVGTLRETFFLNQCSTMATVTMPKKGDFALNGKYLFEVGGKGKTFQQIADEPNSYLAVDGIEMGSSNRIPLWMFGLLY